MFQFSKSIVRQSDLILAMALREFSARHAGTIVGALWTILHPLTIILTYWFVFSVGFKATGPDGSPFILYFLCGMVPWLTFVEIVQGCTTAIIRNPHLIKKTVFPSEVLPLVQFVSATISQAILIAILFAVILLQGYPLSTRMLMVIYCYVALGSL